MTDEAGFKLEGEFFPLVDHFDTETSMAVERSVQMPFAEWIDAYERERGAGSYSVTTMLGLLAASIYQKYPEWSFQRIKRLVKFDPGSVDFEFVAPDEEPEGAEVVQLPPPAEAEAPSAPSSQRSIDVPDPPNSAAIEESDSGAQGSLTTTA